MTQPAALFLADVLANDPCSKAHHDAAAAELRRLHQICRDIYEVWGGSEALPIPETAPEAYLLKLVAQMRDAARGGLE